MRRNRRLQLNFTNTLRTVNQVTKTAFKYFTKPKSTIGWMEKVKKGAKKDWASNIYMLDINGFRKNGRTRKITGRSNKSKTNKRVDRK